MNGYDRSSKDRIEHTTREKYQPFLEKYSKFYKKFKLIKSKNNKDLTKSFKHCLNFTKGKQGITGLLKSDDNKKYVFKYSQYFNFLSEHEFTVLRDLTKISMFCPNFCRVYGTLTALINPDKNLDKDENPFIVDDSLKYKPIEKNILLMEYIEDAPKFCNYIKSSQIQDKIIISIIKQTLLAILLSQKLKSFTHYDLHSDNILIKKCDYDTAFLYKFDDSTKFLVPTYGYYPVIIDCGFSYSKGLEDNYLYPSLGHTEVGFLSYKFDHIADPKLFLVSVSNEFKMYKEDSKIAKKLRRIVKNIYCNNLSIEKDCGWDNIYENSVSDMVCEYLEDVSSTSSLFKEFEHYCIDIVQSLIILPMEERPYDNIEVSYGSFLEEFSKIENEISSKFYLLYILHGIVEAARLVQADYHHAEKRIKCVRIFKKEVLERVDSIAKFCQFKDLDYEKMLCSLIVLAKNLEGFYFQKLKTILKKKNKEYSKLPLDSIEEVYACLDVNFLDDYKYNKNTTIFEIDCQNKNIRPLNTKNIDLDQLNNTYSLCRGMLF